MAIQTNIFAERGEVFTDAYCRIERVTVTRNQMHVEYGVYKTQQEAVDEIPPFLIFDVHGEHVLNSEKNIWQQAYDIIKQRHPNCSDV